MQHWRVDRNVALVQLLLLSLPRQVVNSDSERLEGIVSEGTDISDTEVLQLPIGHFPEPKCSYTVHLVNRYGPTLNRHVYIGEPLYHQWQCSYGSRQDSVYCMVVQNCTVTDSRPSSPKVEIIDSDGCSLFPKLIPNIIYHNDLEAGMPISAFSLDIDTPAVEFNCSIQLQLKRSNNRCRRPICDSVHRYLRR